MLNEILQWVFIAAALAPHVTRVVRDFKEEEEETE